MPLPPLRVAVLNWGATTKPLQTPDATDGPFGATQRAAVAEEFSTALKKKKKKKQPLTTTQPPLENLEAAREREERGEMNRLAYRALYGRLQDHLHPEGEGHKDSHLRVPPPQVVRPGSKGAVVANFGVLCAKLDRPPEHVAAFLQAESGNLGSLDAESRLRLKYARQAAMEQLLRRYIREYVICQACGACTTVIVCDHSRSRLHFLQCLTCKAERRVAPIERGFVALGRGERRAVRAGAAVGSTTATAAVAAGATAGVVATIAPGTEVITDGVAESNGLDGSDGAMPACAAATFESQEAADGVFQATLNVGIIGHVAHGKSSLVHQLTGVRTQKYKQEQERNITIRLGYANCKIYMCEDSSVPPDEQYVWRPSSFKPVRLVDNGRSYRLLRHVSFVDCPGHEALMQNMLSGAAVMDAALLLVAANEPCPAAQTSEHLAASECLGLADVVCVQNKLDLVTSAEAHEHFDSIVRFTEGTAAAPHGVTPICAQLRINLSALCAKIAALPAPNRMRNASSRMILIRSFDVNRPGCNPSELKGGVAGGAVVQGVLRVGDEVEVRPGILGRDSQGKLSCTPLRTCIESLHSESTPLSQAVPGGLIGVGTALDAFLTKEDRLKGQVLGAVGSLPPCFVGLIVQPSLLNHTASPSPRHAATDQATVEDPAIRAALGCRVAAREKVLVAVGAACCTGSVSKVHKDGRVVLNLQGVVCAAQGDTVALSRLVEGKWRLIGRASIVAGDEIMPQQPLLDSAMHAKAVEADSEEGKEMQEEEEEMELPETTDSTTSQQGERTGNAVDRPEANGLRATGLLGKDSDRAPSSATASPLQSAECNPLDPSWLRCRMHSCALPAVHDLVVVRVSRMDEEVGVYATLLEYDGIEGLIPTQELSRKRKGRKPETMSKMTKVGKLEVCIVLCVDDNKGYVDLSKARVEAEDKEATELHYRRSKAVHSIVRAAALRSRLAMQTIYEVAVWPLKAALGCTSHECFCMALKQPEAVFTQGHTPGLSPSLRTTLLEEISQRLCRQAHEGPHAQAEVAVRCLGRSGMDAVRQALLKGVKSRKGSSLELSCRQIAPPSFVLHCKGATDGAAALAALRDAIEAIQTAMSGYAGGLATVTTAPHIVDESDGEKGAAELVERLAACNLEIAGESQ